MILIGVVVLLGAIGAAFGRSDDDHESTDIVPETTEPVPDTADSAPGSRQILMPVRQ